MSKILPKDLSGMTFGNLVVVREVERTTKERRFLCLYPNGKTRFVQAGALLRRISPSISHKPLYAVWMQMKARCSNHNHKSYKDYGGRGIRVCEEWMDFDSFEAWSMNNGYGEGLSIDRIDNNGNYEPNNCRWTNRLVQQNNTRKNRAVTIDGETHNIREWARIAGINSSVISCRLKKGITGRALIQKRGRGWQMKEMAQKREVER